MKLRWIGRYAPRARVFRLVAFLWGAVPRDPGYSRRLSIAIAPHVFRYVRDRDGWFLFIAGVRLHFKWTSRGVLV